MSQPYGTLYLIPVTLGDVDPLEVMPISIKRIVELVDDYIVENEKTARRSIKSLLPEKEQSILEFSLINKFTEPSEVPSFLQPCLEGKPMGLMSEAGVPGVADPGAEVVAIAHQKGIKVVPLVGPSSILMAVMASGLNGQNFAFNGYLPIDNKDRKRRILELEQRSKNEQQAQLFIETPYRNNKMLEVLCNSLNSDTLLCVACDITLPTEFIRTQSISHWKHNKEDFHKRPAIFMIQQQDFSF
ncbi:16S rRNA (cytidine1402-2'-O)-methyltransferase [Nonlabens sp. Hel1_33_55]|uniref:SAM-dependent methyltransferase n=1 Tax=Nonlabens sp. Hel1_33_55 TaxID=1336802 RepID=UPI000875E776|nr:SAM-dependent methyltransferase [Nonlabens sp. Hel1_33_55]SCY06755.1 16S rRNA (cytidine1402-2'-O)-methyltransferase [Nonlabens sp. Hel1_33_55]